MNESESRFYAWVIDYTSQRPGVARTNYLERQMKAAWDKSAEVHTATATAAERERWRGYVVDLRQENFLLTEQSLLAEGIVQACDRMLRDMMHNE